jgi:hypothetical protein
MDTKNLKRDLVKKLTDQLVNTKDVDSARDAIAKLSELWLEGYKCEVYAAIPTYSANDLFSIRFHSVTTSTDTEGSISLSHGKVPVVALRYTEYARHNRAQASTIKDSTLCGNADGIYSAYNTHYVELSELVFLNKSNIKELIYLATNRLIMAKKIITQYTSAYKEVALKALGKRFNSAAFWNHLSYEDKSNVEVGTLGGGKAKIKDLFDTNEITSMSGNNTIRPGFLFYTIKHSNIGCIAKTKSHIKVVTSMKYSSKDPVIASALAKGVINEQDLFITNRPVVNSLSPFLYMLPEIAIESVTSTKVMEYNGTISQGQKHNHDNYTDVDGGSKLKRTLFTERYKTTTNYYTAEIEISDIEAYLDLLCRAIRVADINTDKGVTTTINKYSNGINIPDES